MYINNNVILSIYFSDKKINIFLNFSLDKNIKIDISFNIIIIKLIFYL